jgi:hypothetical protein
VLVVRLCVRALVCNRGLCCAVLNEVAAQGEKDIKETVMLIIYQFKKRLFCCFWWTVLGPTENYLFGENN